MEKKTAFCLTCDDKTTYYTRERTVNETTHDGVEISYDITEAFCDICGDPVWVSEYVDAEIDARWTALEQAYGRALRRGLINEKEMDE